MKPDPRSAEFITLIDRWLDQTATAEEAARLWQAVAECPQCAAALAAASRFESLLEGAVKERASEKKLLAPTVPIRTQEEPRLAQHGLRQVTAQSPNWQAKTRQWAAVAAALIVVGSVCVFFWNEAGMEQPPVVVHELVGPIQQPHLWLPKITSQPSSTQVKLAETAPQEPKELLTTHLDRFFLTGVSLDHVTLGRAIGILQGQLHEVNRDAALALDQLRVLVPTGAAQRRITFHSGAIPFLKAVRAVAALAGCEVEISEPQITITIQQSIYPELVKKRVLSDMLAGRLNASGSASITDPERLAALREDAESLGVKPAADGSVAITRGQWEALKMLTETRDMLGRLPMPSYAIYAVPGNDQPQANRVLTAEEVDKERQKITAAKSVPLVIFTPQPVSPTNRSPIQFQPYGDKISLILQPNYDPEAERRSTMGPQPSSDPIIVSTGAVSSNPDSVLTLSNQSAGQGGVLNNGTYVIKGGSNTLALSGANTYNDATASQVADLAGAGASRLMGANSGNLTFTSNMTIRIQGNVSAETMATVTAAATAAGATLIILPVTTQ